MDLPRRLAAELLGTAFLLCTVVGSGIMGEQLAGGNVAIALLANTLATGAVLVALILTLGGISSHFNPVVTLADAYRGGVGWREVPLYVVAEVVGALIGVIAANLMFGQAAISLSTHARTGGNLWLSEFIATFGLILTVFACTAIAKRACLLRLARTSPPHIGSHLQPLLPIRPSCLREHSAIHSREFACWTFPCMWHCR